MKKLPESKFHNHKQPLHEKFKNRNRDGRERNVQLVNLGNAIGNTIQVKIMPMHPEIECESHTELTEEETRLNQTFMDVEKLTQ